MVFGVEGAGPGAGAWPGSPELHTEAVLSGVSSPRARLWRCIPERRPQAPEALEVEMDPSSPGGPCGPPSSSDPAGDPQCTAF